MKNTYFKLSAVLLLAALLLGGARLGAQSLILTSDEQLNDLMDPDKKLDLSLGYTPYHASLRDICEQGKKQGSKQMVFAFDEFFRQYRQHAGTERRLTPDMDEYVEKIKFVSDFAKKYDIGLCLSLLSPLELGTAYKNQTGHSGRWLAYKVGLRDGQYRQVQRADLGAALLDQQQGQDACQAQRGQSLCLQGKARRQQSFPGP